MPMCHWRRTKPNSDNTEDEQDPGGLQPRQQQRYAIDVERRSNISRSSNGRPTGPILPVPVYPQGGSMRGASHHTLPPPPPRSSTSSSRDVHSHTRNQYQVGLANEVGSYLETLPNELLEDIFLLAISTSFPTEDPNWPLLPMFSKRSYRHSPSNSNSNSSSSAAFYPPAGRERSFSAGREAQGGRLALARALTSAPHLLPTTLSQTCARFRKVLRNAPHLWSYINVTRTISPLPQEQPLTPRQLLGWLPLYITRSRDAHLHIILDTTKFGSFSAPLPSPSSPSTNAIAGTPSSIHSHSILALLLPALPRWGTLTLLTSHIGSPSLAPLLHLIAPLRAPSLTQLRVSADLWRPGIVGYGAPLPAALFSGGSPRLESVVLEGVNLDWRSCMGSNFASNGSGDAGANIMNLAGMSLNRSPSPTPGLFNTLRNLELRFIAGRYPDWEGFTQLLEQGCPHLQRLVIRDDIEEALRAIKPPPLPYFEIPPGSPLSPPLHSPLSATETPTGSRHSASHSSGRTSTSISPASGRFPTHIAALHVTLPPSLGSRRSRSQSDSSSASSSGSSSSSSSPTSPYYHGGHHRSQRGTKRDFRKVHLPNLVHLEVHAFNATAPGVLRSSQSKLALQQATLASGKGGAGVGPSAVEMQQAPPIARFLYLLSTPSIHTLRLSGLTRNEWVGVAAMLGVTSDIEEFSRQRRKYNSGRYSRGSRGSGRSGSGPGYAQAYGPSYNTYEEARTFPYLTTLQVDLLDG